LRRSSLYGRIRRQRLAQGQMGRRIPPA